MWENIVPDGPTSESITEAFEALRSEVLTGSVASSSDDVPWIFTAYLAGTGNRLWFTSQESTKHVQQLRQSHVAAVALWHQPETWGAPLVGVQLAATARETTDPDDAQRGLDAMHAKFPGTQETLPNVDAVIGDGKRTCLFELECTSGTIRSEAALGKGKFAIEWVD